MCWSLLIVSHESQFSGLFGLSCSTQPLLNYNNGHYNGHINYNGHYKQPLYKLTISYIKSKGNKYNSSGPNYFITTYCVSEFMSLESRCATLHLFPTPPSVTPHWQFKISQGRTRYTMCCAESLSRVRLCNPMDCRPPGSSAHGDSPGKNTGVGLHALLQGILPTQGSNPGLHHCRQILHCLRHQGSPGTPWKLINATNQGFLLTLPPTPPPWPPRDTPLPVYFPECRGMTLSCSLSFDPSLQWSRLCHPQPEPQKVCWYHFHVSLHWSWSPLLRLQALCL